MADDPKEEVQPKASPGLFATTRWSLVRRAQLDSATALNQLFERYRGALLVYLRGRQFSPHDAEDLVQEFLVALLRRDFLRNISQQRGKFRSFLLASLRNHLADFRDRQNAQKRGGGQWVESLQATDDGGQVLHDPTSEDPAPDRAFHQAWARTILDHALRRLENECARTGHGALCAALEPVLHDDEEAASYGEIAARLNLTEGAVKVAAFRIRQRLRGIVREEILQTVDNEADWESEVRELSGLFGK